MAVILITHDLGVVAEVADEVIVMYARPDRRAGTLDQIFYDPQHPYTWGLLGSLAAARPARASRRLSQITGQPPSLLHPPEGCHFRPRCPHAFDRCTEVPPLEVRGGEAGHARPLLALAGAEAGAARRRERPASASRCPRRDRGCVPRPRMTPAHGAPWTLLEVRDLVKHFPIKSGS